MRITIVGTGSMARAIAARALAGGHHVTFVGTYLAKAEDLVDEFRDAGDTRASDTVEGDLVVLAVPYTQAPHALRQHAGELEGKVIVDPTNPVDVSIMEPIEVELGSAAMMLAAVAPVGVPIVKAFNTTFAGPLLAGHIAGQPLDVFIAADESSAKDLVSQLVADGGQRPIDAGELRRARELEAMGYLHMRIQASLGTFFDTTLKVVAP
jgi:hypothetical protein